MIAAALLYEQSLVALDACSRKEANALLEEWEHPLGACNRPFRTESWLLAVDGQPVVVMVSAGIVSPTVAGYRRTQVVELARIARSPEHPWAMRPALRLWRAVLAQRFESWHVEAAIAYGMPGTPGDIYRFDGWERIGEVRKARVGKSSTWSKPSATDTIADGKKTLWVFRYEAAKQLSSDTQPANSKQLASDEQRAGDNT